MIAMPEVPEEDHRHRDAEGHVNHQESPRTDRDRPPNAHQSPRPERAEGRDGEENRDSAHAREAVWAEASRDAAELENEQRDERERRDSVDVEHPRAARLADDEAIEARTDQDRDRDGEAPVDDAGGGSRRSSGFTTIRPLVRSGMDYAVGENWRDSRITCRQRPRSVDQYDS